MARAALAGLLVCLLALAGCDAIAGLGQLREDLHSAGYDAGSINQNTTNGVTVLSIEVVMPDAVPADEDAEKVAEVVWTKYPHDVDRLQVVMNGALRLDATPEDLTGLFGERPEGLVESSEEGGPSSALTVVLILAGAAVFAGLMVLLWHRGRRPPPPVAPPPAYPHQQPGGQYQYPPQPPQG